METKGADYHHTPSWVSTPKLHYEMPAHNCARSMCSKMLFFAFEVLIRMAIEQIKCLCLKNTLQMYSFSSNKT